MRTPGGRIGDGEILDGVREVARRHLDFDGSFALDTPIVQGLGLDSLKLLTLVIEVENHFRVRLDEESEGGVVTVGDLVAAIRRGLAERDR